MAPPCRAPTSPEHRSPRLGAGLAWRPTWSSDFLLIFKRVRLGFAPPQNFGGASVLASESIYK